jgi:hypothetical protein
MRLPRLSNPVVLAVLRRVDREPAFARASRMGLGY